VSRVIDEVLAAVPAPYGAPAPRRRRRRSRAATATPATRRKCTFALSGELADELRRLCAVQGLSQREVVERLISAHVARHRHRL
jgi:hypothetical protein